MKQGLIICKSQTEAIRCARLLTACGVTTGIVRPPRDMRISSCTYAVRIRQKDLVVSQQCLRQRGFSPIKICSLSDDGQCIAQ